MAQTHEGLGQRDTPAIHAFGQQIEFLRKIGQKKIEERSGNIATQIIEELQKIKGVYIYTSNKQSLRSAVVTFRPANLESITVADAGWVSVQRRAERFARFLFFDPHHGPAARQQRAQSARLLTAAHVKKHQFNAFSLREHPRPRHHQPHARARARPGQRGHAHSRPLLAAGRARVVSTDAGEQPRAAEASDHEHRRPQLPAGFAGDGGDGGARSGAG